MWRPELSEVGSLIKWAVLCLLVLVNQSLTKGEVVQGCSTVNARAVWLEDGWVLMRDDGKILTTERYCHGGEYSDGLIVFERCVAGDKKQFVYLTLGGKVAVEVSVALAKGFSEGLAAVEDEHYMWGYIDRTGRVVIPFQFSTASPFQEGLAAVQDENGSWRYIDRTGKTILTPHVEGVDISMSDFTSGVAQIMFQESHGEDVLKGLMDFGEWLLKPGSDLTGEFRDGLIAFWPDDGSDKMGFVDEKGDVVIAAQFTGAPLLPFQEGLAPSTSTGSPRRLDL